MKISYCKKCLNPSNHPLGIIYNNEGVCGGCLVHEEKYEINWDKKIEKLGNFFNSKKNKNKYYDCVIPVVGNGDDFFVTHVAKKVLKLNPLLVSYNTGFNTKVGIRNLARLISKLDCDHFQITSNPNIIKRISQNTFNKIGDFYWHILAGNQAFPVQVAVKMKIPIILWGVNGWLDQVGKFSHNHEAEMTQKIWEEFSLRNLITQKVINKNINQKDIAPFIYPELDEIKKVGVRGIYLGNYVLWDAKKQTEEMITKYGYETLKQQRTHNSYESIYCKNNAGVHDYIKFLKYGYGKVTDHINRDIRFKRISREDAKFIIAKYERNIPEDLNYFLKWIKLSKKQFFDRFKNNSFNFKESKYNKMKIDPIILNKIENKLHYIKTNNLEKENFNQEYIVFGRTYMDEGNFKAVEG